MLGMRIIRTTYLFTLSLLIISISLSFCTRTEKGPVLKVYFEEVPLSTDPAHIRDRFSYNAALQVYEGLYEYHYLKRPYQISPVLAESMPVISDNGRSYTIKIKKEDR
jgi:ABC-type oligopeptide transport system substrate-binding subunit